MFVETLILKRGDFINFDISPPKSGLGYLVTCSDPKLFNVLIVLDDSEEKIKQTHESTVIAITKLIKKA